MERTTTPKERMKKMRDESENLETSTRSETQDTENAKKQSGNCDTTIVCESNGQEANCDVSCVERYKERHSHPTPPPFVPLTVLGREGGLHDNAHTSRHPIQHWLKPVPPSVE